MTRRRNQVTIAAVMFLLGILVVVQLRSLAGMPPVVFVVEAADVAERVLDIEGLGGFRRGHVGVSYHDQSTGAEYAGDQRGQAKLFGYDL